MLKRASAFFSLFLGKNGALHGAEVLYINKLCGFIKKNGNKKGNNLRRKRSKPNRADSKQGGKQKDSQSFYNNTAA